MPPRKKNRNGPVIVTYNDKFPLRQTHPLVYARAMELAGGNESRLRAQSYTEIMVVNQERNAVR